MDVHTYVEHHLSHAASFTFSSRRNASGYLYFVFAKLVTDTTGVQIRHNATGTFTAERLWKQLLHSRGNDVKPYIDVL